MISGRPQPKIGPWRDRLDSLLLENGGKPARERLTLIRVFEELRALGYEGGYDAVRRYARTWSKQHAGETANAYVPLTFAPGEAYQFDCSHEIVVMDGVTTIVKVAHVRLCHSRMMLARAYPRETQEMVFDAHERAFAFFRGASSRGIYDNMKTAVETIFVGKDRQYNRRFLQMCSHHLVKPVACTPASGWEKGQVENQVGLVRERFFTPRLRVKSYDELNAWLMDKSIAWAKAHPHPERPDRKAWDALPRRPPRSRSSRARVQATYQRRSRSRARLSSSRFERQNQVGRNDVADHPVQSLVSGAIDEGLARTQQGAGVDRDHHRPFQALCAVNGDDLDCVAFGVDPSFIMGRAVAPFPGEIADELLQSAHAIRPRAFQKGLDIGGRAGAAVPFARGENGPNRQALGRFGEQQRRRGRPRASPAREARR